MSYFFSILNTAAIYGCLAALQVVLLKRMGLAFAAIPVFAGLGAYAVATLDVSIFLAVLLLMSATVAALAFGQVSNHLPKDLYLLGTLAAIEVCGAAIGASKILGGREGLPAPAQWEIGGRGFETQMLKWNLLSLVLVVGLVRWVLSSSAGIAIDRLNENPRTAKRWFPAYRFQSLTIVICCSLAMIIGGLYLAYNGRVAPTIFSLDFAILVLSFSIMAWRLPELAVFAAALYWVLPYLMTKQFSMNQQAASEFIRIAWGALVVTAIIVPNYVLEIRQKRNRIAHVN